MTTRERIFQIMERSGYTYRRSGYTYRSRSGYTYRKVVDKIRLSVALISQYLKGVYNGKIDNIKAPRRNFLAREDDRARCRDVRVYFVLTHLAKLELDLFGVPDEISA